jgi:PAS domain-containing protein
MVVSNPRRPDNPLEVVNDAFCELTGYDESEIIAGTPLPRWLPDPAAATSNPGLNPCAKTYSRRHLELPTRTERRSGMES